MSLKSKLNDILLYLENKSKTPLSMRDLTDKDSNLFCFSVKGEFKGHEVTGFGQSFNKDKAFFIAVMELLERFIVNHFRVENKIDNNLIIRNKYEYYDLKSTNGVAVHFNPKKAFENALDELIERHIVLKALAEGVPPMKVSRSVNQFKIQTKYPLDFYTWVGPYKRNVVIVRSKHKGHTIYGFGCHKKLSMALEKSFLELYPRLSLFDDFADNKKPFITSDEHTLFHWEGNADWTDNFFKRSSQVIKSPVIDTHLKKSDLLISKIKICPKLKKMGVKAIVVNSTKLQQLFKGSWANSKININAIKASTLPPEVHMIG